MELTRTSLKLLVALLLFSSPVSAFGAALVKLAAPPEGDRWFSISMGGDRVGFAHLSITKAGDGYRIDSEGSVKMRVMGFSREATSKESYLVKSDLAIQSFTSESRIDGSPLVLKGEVTPKGVRVTVESGDGKKERTLKLKGSVYPSQALNVYPLMHGTAVGKTIKIPMLDVESVKVKQVKVEVIGEEKLSSGEAAVHLRNDLYPMVDNDIWVDLKGNSIKESVRDDLVLTLAEDEASAKASLADAALSKRDMVLDFSLVQVNPPLARPEELKKLSVEFTGVPAALPLLQGKGQLAARLPDGRVVFSMPNPSSVPAPEEVSTAADLEANSRIPSDAPEIISRKNEIVGSEKEPAQMAKLLVQWVAKEIKGTVTDNQSVLETLKNRNGNCQTHARLYAALARAAGIPTRFVSGLIYSKGQGFVYHSWAESYLNGWVPVDPTFGEFPASITHIKFVTGDSPDEMGVLAGLIGRLQAKVVEKTY